MVGPQRPQFVLFGSSIVQLSYRNGGWGAVLADIYARKADILLRGYNGWNSKRALEVVNQVFPKDAAVQPSLVIVYFGGNDSVAPHPTRLGPHVPLSEYTENMRKIATHLKSLSEETRIIYLSPPPMNDEKYRESKSEQVRTNENCQIYSEACKSLCKEMGLKFVDLWTAIQKMDDWKNTSFTDGVHLSSEGSKVVVEEILKVLKEVDWKPSLHPKSLTAEFGEYSTNYLVSPRLKHKL
ncbi:GDSL esterase/lipase CPRD49-like isoform X2 [Papaver somniferum]|uniref:GDSL esterase/lipase CPRD49-like isoform X2 n=1 Tax=Papaver somniferum TaxID=3469 RepID=UPI000E6FD2EC|nr:GDSL esterase/lipase CPRD49-like isoform X2 [Papaver somniferum]